ncbi:hypothetical protein [Xanthomonas phage FMYAK-P1]|uniref:Uncharacterized protein n=1 Tax=Xanthomonas phage FMYAK-P1 TaxID=2886031 RepID=A0AAE9CA93_9CAUD|nr:hypothetical protein P9A50_gp18 [Xanthomonas phage FMYAK-P1]UGL62732.1 hypothetical protein [Xanthomonas phage FMYAK-P1]
MALSDADRHAMALRAIDMMDMMAHDSFGPIDAVRSLPEYDNLSEEDRKAVLDDLYTSLR